MIKERKQTEVIFVRHGETDFNKANLYFGHLDPELNETGINQILNTKETLKKIEDEIDIVFCSPLKRCSKSMELLELKNISKIFEESFKELSFGVFEGKTYEEIKEKYPNKIDEMRNNWKKFKAEKGESLEELLDRTIEKLEEIMIKYENKKILIIAHAGVIKVILSYFLYGNVDGYWKLKVDNGSISKICKLEDGYVYKDYINRI